MKLYNSKPFDLFKLSVVFPTSLSETELWKIDLEGNNFSEAILTRSRINEIEIMKRKHYQGLLTHFEKSFAINSSYIGRILDQFILAVSKKCSVVLLEFFMK